MKLTEEEKLMVNRLREAKQSWLWKRYVFLLIGAFEGFVGLYLLIQVSNERRVSAAESLFFSFAFPLTVGLCAALIKFATRNWDGIPTQVLLLKLLDNATDKSSDDHVA